MVSQGASHAYRTGLDQPPHEPQSTLGTKMVYPNPCKEIKSAAVSGQNSPLPSSNRGLSTWLTSVYPRKGEPRLRPLLPGTVLQAGAQTCLGETATGSPSYGVRTTHCVFLRSFAVVCFSRCSQLFWACLCVCVGVCVCQDWSEHLVIPF